MACVDNYGQGIKLFTFVNKKKGFLKRPDRISQFVEKCVTSRQNLKSMIPEIHIEDYNYPLPDERIAKYPLPERDASKLLHYEGGHVDAFIFRQLPDLLPENALMVFNDTKVVPARMHFQRATGAHIEIFCLEPVKPVEYATAFAATESCVWKCVIGNAKRWKDDVLSLYNPDIDAAVASMDLRADLLVRDGQTGQVRFSWRDGSPFSRVLEVCGTIPIPPYLNRDSEAIDVQRYQTTYARIRGSVAARRPACISRMRCSPVSGPGTSTWKPSACT